MKPVTGLLVGVIFMIFGLVLAIGRLPFSIADALSYAGARACGEAMSNVSGCWTELDAHVTGTSVVRSGKASIWYVSLGDEFGLQRVPVVHTGVFGQLQLGESVTARFWREQVVLIRTPGGAELLSENEPGTQAGFDLLITGFILLFGGVFLLGALGVHRHQGSWARKVPRDEFGREMWDAVAPPVRRWVEATFAIGIAALFCSAFGYALFGIPVLPAALVSAGLAALLWTWTVHHRARVAQARGDSVQISTNP